MVTENKTEKPSRSRSNTPTPSPVFEDSRFQAFGTDVLAPIVAEFLGRLHAAVLAASQQGIPSLFCHRAGLRILHLYTEWLAARGEAVPPHVHTFKTSRIAALKAAFASAPSMALTGIGMHMAGLDLHAIASALVDAALPDDGERIAQMPLHEFMASGHPVAAQIEAHLSGQSALMARYLKRLAGKSPRIMLIDSGWAGTSQLVLEQAFPDFQFEGVYFGTIGRASILGKSPGAMHGLMFNAEGFQFDRRAPETVFVLHRHLIESLFEPDLPTISSLTADDIAGRHTLPPASIVARPSCAWDRMYGIVLEAICGSASAGPAARALRYREALAALAQTLMYPTPEAARIASGKYRSRDLGIDGGADALLATVDRFPGDHAAARIRDALWATGQAAMEYADAGERHLVQERLLAAAALPQQQGSYFVSSTDAAAGQEGRSDVAIITRTKNRPTLLRRAADSVARQSYADLDWVVVNDGGELDDVLGVIDDSLADPSRIMICHNQRSLGMEGASNAGIRASSSEWVVIHDDDDSWHPGFLQATTAFLSANRAVYKGVIAGTVLVSEEIVGDQVIEHAREPYQAWVKSVHLAEMAIGNFFAPIAFVFSRSIYDIVGGYDHRLPVLGDWDFNLRFLLEADIGVVDAPLAYYHHRNAGAAGAYSNSVVGGIDKHLAYNAIVRNKYVREAATNPKLGILANLMNAGYLHGDMRARVDGVRAEVANGIDNVIETGTRREANADSADARWVVACALAGHVASTSGNMTVGELLSALEAQGMAAARAADLVPPPDFDDGAYLGRYPDIAAAVARGEFACGYAHYILHGRTEGRIRSTMSTGSMRS